MNTKTAWKNGQVSEGREHSLPREKMMHAIIQEHYGAVGQLKVREVMRPKIQDDQVLIKVMATSVHADVWHVVAGFPHVLRLFGSGLLRPKNPIPGTDASGVVCEVGKNVTEFSLGDEVFGEVSRKMQWQNGGSYAEYVAVYADTLAKKPKGVTFQEAAAVPTAGYIAWLNLSGAGEVRPGDEVLVNGAGGAVGSIAVQILKSRGARVTAVEMPGKLDFARWLGADQVLDGTKGELENLSGRFDLVFDVASNLARPLWTRLLSRKGQYVLIGHDHYGASGHAWLGEIPRFFLLMFRSLFDKRLPNSLSMPAKKQVMKALGELLESGQLTPRIGKTFPLSGVNEALALLTEEKVLGRIVLLPHQDV